MTKMTDNKEKFLLALLSNSTITEASKQVGISAQTGHQYLNEDDFKKKYAEVRRNTFNLATNKLQQSAVKAVEVLNELMTDKETPASTRVQASRAIIDNAYKAYELDDLQERLEEIEKTLKARGGAWKRLKVN